MALPPILSGVHQVFHVSMQKKYHGDGNYIIRWNSLLLDENFSYEEEPVSIFDREVRKLRSREIASINVQWKNRPVEESTLEKEADMQERYPQLFTDLGTRSRHCFLLVIVLGRTMSKLVSIVTTCLVVSSSGIIFDKNILGRRITRRTVKVMTDGDRPSWSRRTVTNYVVPLLCNSPAALLITLDDK